MSSQQLGGIDLHATNFKEAMAVLKMQLADAEHEVIIANSEKRKLKKQIDILQERIDGQMTFAEVNKEAQTVPKTETRHAPPAGTSH